MNNHASSSLACSRWDGNQARIMENQKYGKERRIRWWYRRMGRRRTYIQRRVYEDFGLDMESGRERNEEEDWVRSRRSTAFGRSLFLSQRRGVVFGWRTRIPGRYRHESKQRRRKCGRAVRRRTTRSWKWYTSDVDVTGIDRRTSRRIFLPRRRWFGSSKQAWKEKSDANRREDRRRIIWIGRRRYRWRSPERMDLSKRRSRGRTAWGYLGCVERWARRRYRKQGRKRKK